MTIIEESISHLFYELGLKNIPIVVLRNYERLPDIGNDLDTGIRITDIDFIREILLTDFFKSRWTEICEVRTHNSHIIENNIFIFKFFNRNLDEYMQIDFFNGFLFKGQPFFSTNDFLKKTRFVNNFPIVSADVELFIKYFQLYDAINSKQWERVEKYKNQAFQLRTFLTSSIDIDINQLNRLLADNRFLQFQIILRKYRNRFLNKFFMNNPIRFFLNVINRFGSFYSFFVTNPFIVKCSLSKSIDLELVKNALNNLVEKKCFRGYYIHSDLNFLNRLSTYMKISQSGGVIVSLNTNGVCFYTENDIKSYIISEFVKKHAKIYIHQK